MSCAVVIVAAHFTTPKLDAMSSATSSTSSSSSSSSSSLSCNEQFEWATAYHWREALRNHTAPLQKFAQFLTRRRHRRRNRRRRHVMNSSNGLRPIIGEKHFEIALRRYKSLPNSCHVLPILVMSCAVVIRPPRSLPSAFARLRPYPPPSTPSRHPGPPSSVTPPQPAPVRPVRPRDPGTRLAAGGPRARDPRDESGFRLFGSSLLIL